MTTRKNVKRTTVYFPLKLLEEAKKRGINISQFCTQCLEMDLYEDDPKFIEKKISEFDENTDKERNALLIKLKLAEERHQQKKERLSTEEPEVWNYRTTTPKDKECS